MCSTPNARQGAARPASGASCPRGPSPSACRNAQLRPVACTAPSASPYVSEDRRAGPVITAVGAFRGPRAAHTATRLVASSTTAISVARRSGTSANHACGLPSRCSSSPTTRPRLAAAAMPSPRPVLLHQPRLLQRLLHEAVRQGHPVLPAHDLVKVPHIEPAHTAPGTAGGPARPPLAAPRRIDGRVAAACPPAPHTRALHTARATGGASGATTPECPRPGTSGSLRRSPSTTPPAPSSPAPRPRPDTTSRLLRLSVGSRPPPRKKAVRSLALGSGQIMHPYIARGCRLTRPAPRR